MAEIERFTPDDRRGIEQLHRRTLGNEAAERLPLHWDWARGSGSALGAELSSATRGRLDEMRWPRAQPLPCLVKPLSRRAFRIPTWPVMINRLVSAITLPIVHVVSRTQPLKEEVEVVRRFDARVDRLWERLANPFAPAGRRDDAS